MSLVAGVLTRRGTGRVPDRLRSAVAEGLSRSGEWISTIFEAEGRFAIHLDMGVRRTTGVHRAVNGDLTLVCGRPLIARADRDGPDPARDLEELHLGFAGSDSTPLQLSNGTFSAVHLPRGNAPVVLATDHLGVRPLYLLRTPSLVIFSSVLRLFPGLPGVSLTVDPRGLLETASRGYAYGDRTPYREVRRIRAAEIWTLDPDLHLGSHVFHRWDQGRRGDMDPVDDRTVKSIGAHFRESVRVRSGGEPAATAFLSGGLDSRAIVSVLRDLGTRVSTYNFSVPGEQDHVYARAYASKVGAVHRSLPRSAPVALQRGEWSHLLRSALDRLPGAVRGRPAVAWSGDGGSVGLGGSAGLSDSVARSLESGDLEGACRTYASGVPPRAFRPAARRQLRGAVADGVKGELDALDEPEPLGRFLTFLLLNDQRRHLDGHFEELDRHRIELELPFFDATFLKAVHALPAKAILKHRLYHRVVTALPEDIRSVPWQVYPGHLPCPVPAYAVIPTQWEANGNGRARIRRGRRVRELRQAMTILGARKFPGNLLSRPRLAMIMLFHFSLIRDFGYVIDFAHEVVRHAGAAGTVDLERTSTTDDPRG